MEFRHESWWQEAVFRELSQCKISFCGMSHPQLPSAIIQNSPLFYYRFHGENQLYASKYSEQQLQNFAAEVTTHEDIDEAYIFFNNDINTNAIYNAQSLQEIMQTLSHKK
jgi:uncharacterized protein YecE (DUF72 family)